MTPRVSILIPNFNNGKQSSKSGAQDFMRDLLRSLWDTLHDDPTAIEILAYDDGSTDDSLATLREWAKKMWPASSPKSRAGKPFLHLTEAKHCGFLSQVANKMCKAAKGEILVRLDGDITILTRHWVAAVCDVFDRSPKTLGIVGPKQLGPDYRIHAFGDWILHPNGYIHVAGGLDRYAVRQPVEVDHVMGCFHCMKREVFDAVGGYDENFLRGQTEDLGLRSRLKGYYCIAIPQVEFVHFHALRKARETTADSGAGIMKGLKTFEDKWGFSRLAPDLDEVRKKYAGTPLLWNPRWFGAPGEYGSFADPEPPADVGAINIDATDWGRYAKDNAFRNHVDFRVAVALEVTKQTGVPRKAAHLPAGVGLIGHLLALNRMPTVGIDRFASRVAFAQRCTANRAYPSGPATFVQQTHPRTLPLVDGEVDVLLVFDELEKHPNPVALLREASRVLAADGSLVIVSQRKLAREDGPSDVEHRYRWGELLTQVQAAVPVGEGSFQITIDPAKDDPARDMIVVARRGQAKPQAGGAGAGGGRAKQDAKPQASVAAEL